MLPAKYGFSSGNEHDRLCVVNNHGRALDHVAYLQLVEQENRRVIHAPYAIEVHGVRRVSGGTIDRALLQCPQLLEDGRSQRVKRFANAPHLFMYIIPSQQLFITHDSRPAASAKA